MQNIKQTVSKIYKIHKLANIARTAKNFEIVKMWENSEKWRRKVGNSETRAQHQNSELYFLFVGISEKSDLQKTKKMSN